MKKLLTVTLLAALASPALALEPLSQEKHINDSLRAAAIGDAIRRNCDSISPRMIRVLTEARKLERYALDKGYSREQVDAFIDSDADQDRLEAEAARWLAGQGVTKGDKESYCKVGRAEIARKSLTGYLLKEN